MLKLREESKRTNKSVGRILNELIEKGAIEDGA